MNLKTSTKQKRHVRPVVILLLFVVVGVMGLHALEGFAKREPFAQLWEHSKAAAQTLTVASGTSYNLSPGELYSQSAVLIRLRDHAVLMEKNSGDRIFPASLTKMMTVLVAIEELPNLDEQVDITHSTFNELADTDASTAGFLPGEEVSVRDLLYGALLPSGAECCMTLAEKAAGSQDAFVALMNKKAESLGMTGTQFENVTGLHNPDHYTTVRDLAVLLCSALKNETFKAVFTASRFSVGETNRHPQGFTIRSTLFKSLKSRALKNGQILGGKTGYTQQAGLCLASLADVGDKDYILVTAGAKGNHKTEQYDIEDALTVYNSLS